MTAFPRRANFINLLVPFLEEQLKKFGFYAYFCLEIIIKFPSLKKIVISISGNSASIISSPRSGARAQESCWSLKRNRLEYNFVFLGFVSWIRRIIILMHIHTLWPTKLCLNDWTTICSSFFLVPCYVLQYLCFYHI